MNEHNTISNNTLTVIALTNEYCHDIEHSSDITRDQFMAQMLKLIPRIYIAISDVELEGGYSEYYIEPALDELAYEQVRDMLKSTMGENDDYLEVFVEDMKYSDTPIVAFVSENLADLYQEFYNLIQSVKEAPNDARQSLVEQCKENFINYWGQILCNVLRALNDIFYNTSTQDEY